MLNLNYRDTKPIYIQIKDGLKKLMIGGALESDEKLPSVRELAATLAINPNTIQRAYRELETEGFVYSVSGKGTFVSAELRADEERKEILFRQFDETAEELMYLSVACETLKERLDQLRKREGKR
ncbi:MAG: GntR family transcriptional regulator [Lachnospiraceae bacterium]|nr:GntR family transcriptional regulator [Lachnospiraceae bacterium]